MKMKDKEIMQLISGEREKIRVCNDILLLIQLASIRFINTNNKRHKGVQVFS